MSHISATLKSAIRRWGWAFFSPVMAVCAADAGSGPLVAEHPTAVSDLTVAGTTEVSVTLSFTQVDDGMGQPAHYEVRYSVGPMSWGSATPAGGSCAAPVAGTAVGSSLSCSVLGLSPSTSYNFQVIAFRGSMNAGAVFSEPSNVAAAST